MHVTRYALYLHDYGSQIGLRLAMKRPERVAALIIQNGDIYEDELGPKYEALRKYWANPTPAGRAKLAAAVSEKGFRDEFVGEVAEHLVERISPNLWKLSWPLMQTPQRREIAVGLMEGLRENLEWFSLACTTRKSERLTRLPLAPPSAGPNLSRRRAAGGMRPKAIIVPQPTRGPPCNRMMRDSAAAPATMARALLLPSLRRA